MPNIEKYYEIIVKEDFPPLMKEQRKAELQNTFGFALWNVKESFLDFLKSLRFLFIKLFV